MTDRSKGQTPGQIAEAATSLTPPSALSDSALLTEIMRAAGTERRSTADLLALLAEVDRRKLYLCRGYPSLFAYCTRALHFSEPAAYSRITAARAARQFPTIFTLLADGDVTLTTVTLLAAHLTADNHEALLAAARHKGKREVDRLVAILDPQPAVAPSVRRLPARHDPVRPAMLSGTDEALATEVQTVFATSTDHAEPRPRTLGMVPVRATLATPSASRGIVAPLDADRYLLKVTISGDAHAKLDRIRDLLRHSVPNGDPSVIVERALSALLENLQKSKHAETRTPRVTSETVRATRHIPAAVKRAVWARDGGRCAFIGADERCPETGFLEYHHVIPFAAGGTTTVENLELRCRAHNGFEADRFFGRAFVSRQRDRAQSKRTLSGQSSRPAVRPSG